MLIDLSEKPIHQHTQPSKPSNHSASLDADYISHMRHLLSDPSFSDIAFQVDSHHFTAHKCILAARCKFFNNMFLSTHSASFIWFIISGGMQESTTSQICFTDILPTIFKGTHRWSQSLTIYCLAMLEFIYCGEIVLTEELALGLVEAANKYALPELKTRCEEFLVNTLRPEAIVERVELAERLDAMVLRDGAIAYLIRNAKDAAVSKIEMDGLSKGFLVDLLSKSVFKYGLLLFSDVMLCSVLF